jgi:hypothetical protein
MRTLGQGPITLGRDWCVGTVTFSNGEGDGILKVFRTNPDVFPDLPGGRYGWAEASIDDFRDGPFAPERNDPFAFGFIPVGTLLSFEVHSGCDGGCNGTVTITFARGPAQ